MKYPLWYQQRTLNIKKLLSRSFFKKNYVFERFLWRMIDNFADKMFEEKYREVCLQVFDQRQKRTWMAWMIEHSYSAKKKSTDEQQANLLLYKFSRTRNSGRIVTTAFIAFWKFVFIIDVLVNYNLNLNILFMFYTNLKHLLWKSCSIMRNIFHNSFTILAKLQKSNLRCFSGKI